MSTKKIYFTKMHGAGNDFVVLDAIHQNIPTTPEFMRFLAHRQLGIGADQILLVEPSVIADFKYRIFNADGSEVEHCGNGARCFVRFIHEQGLSTRNPLTAEIATGILTLEDTEAGVLVAMGSVRFDAEAVGLDTEGLVVQEKGRTCAWHFPVDETTAVWLQIAAISNPHAVIYVPDCATAPVQTIGAIIESHPRFRHRVNVGWMQIIDTHTIALRVYERGAGETLACGTGACAAAAIGIEQGLLESPVTVQMRGGQLQVHWDGQQLQMSGPVATVYQGTLLVPSALIH